MRAHERLALYAALATAVLLLLRAGIPTAPAAAAADEPEEVYLAVCAVPAIVNDLMASDRFRPAIEEFIEEQRASIRDLEEQLDELSEELNAMDRDDPAAQETFQRFAQLRREYEQRRAEINRNIEERRTGALQDAFQLARSTASAIAEDLGYNYVIASVDDDEDLSTDNSQLLLRQMLARPVIFAPRSADITADVRADLNLE